jgi:hypothetical protein
MRGLEFSENVLAPLDEFPSDQCRDRERLIPKLSRLASERL